ncbi:NmrA family protein [bacterium]|nr:MAG: NmrA family protein [bacterium]
MATIIAVAGATGNLGGKIVAALLSRGAGVRALVRPGTSDEKRQKLEGVEILEVDPRSVAELTEALRGASCVVSALAGLREVIVDAQSTLLDAAIAAGLPRFIPSDYSIDFTKLPEGENRNLDLRREFHQKLDEAPIASTSILNGAFMEMLLGGMPLLDRERKTVSYWENPDQRLDFTTMDDTAAFTAAAALDSSTPKTLRIAGDSISASELAKAAGLDFKLVRLGSLEDLAEMIQQARSGDTQGENELYPRWQGMEYLHGMFGGRAKLEPLDNDRYSDLGWTRVKDLLAGQ